MAKFCIYCGRALKDGEVCTCQVNTGVHQNDAQSGANDYYQSGQPGANGYYQSGQPGANDYYQSGQPGANGYYQSGQPGGNGYYQSGQPGANGYYQSGQPGANGYYQPSQPGGNGYYQQERRPEMDWMNDKAKRLAVRTKNMFAEILPVLKAPITRGKGLMDSGNGAVGVEFIISKAIVAIIMLLLAIVKVKGMMGDYADFVEIPYFGLIFVVLVLTAGLDFLESAIMHLFTRAFGGVTSFSRMLSWTGVRALYHSIGMMIIGLLALASLPAAMLIGAIILLFFACLEHHLYVAGVEYKEDRKLYAFLLEKICFMIVIILVFMMFSGIISKMPMPYRF